MSEICSNRACAMKGREVCRNADGTPKPWCGYCERMRRAKLFLIRPDLFCVKAECKCKFRFKKKGSQLCGCCHREAEKTWADVVKNTGSGPAPEIVCVSTALQEVLARI